MVETNDSTRMSFWEVLKCGSGTARDRRNQYVYLAWLVAWAIAFVGGKWILVNRMPESEVFAWILAVLPTLMLVGAVFAYIKFLREADELIRKIQMDALAVAFGIGVIMGLAYETLELVGVPLAEPSLIAVTMMVVWSLAQFDAIRRYR